MIPANLGPAVAKHLGDADDDKPADLYREALCLRAALCAAAVKIRAVDPAVADQLLNEERAIAHAMIAP